MNSVKIAVLWLLLSSSVVLAVNPEDDFSSRAEGIVLRLTGPERIRLYSSLKVVVAGKATYKDVYEVDRKAGWVCRSLVSQSAVALLAASESPGLNWAAKNLSPEQSLDVVLTRISDHSLFRELTAALTEVSEGKELSNYNWKICDSVIGPHPAIKTIQSPFDRELSELLAKAIRQSKALEQTEPKRK